MGQKTNPIANRLGFIRGWDSNWYGGNSFAEKLIEDQNIRKYINARIPKGSISKVVLERTLRNIFDADLKRVDGPGRQITCESV